jgi:hypothetical protein
LTAPPTSGRPVAHDRQTTTPADKPKPGGARQQPQAVVQVRREAVDPESLDARCRELDRQRNPVELSANFGYDWGVRVPQLELVQAPPGAGSASPN